MAKGTFRSLKVFNYRVWAIGSLLSNVGRGSSRSACSGSISRSIGLAADSLLEKEMPQEPDTLEAYCTPDHVHNMIH